MGKLSGKVALITGGSSGIGLATAKRFIEEGANVVIFARDGAEVLAACESMRPNLHGVVGDVSKLEDLEKLFATIKEKFGHLDIVFANAGGGAPGTVFDMTEENFDKTFAVNAKGVFFTIQKALPLLREGSSIILTASAMHNKGGGGFSAYTASKAAVRSFARSWANDLKERKIRVNSISPGYTKTPIYEKSGINEAQLKQLEQITAPQIPIGRFGRPEENAAAVLFLASDESTYITGTDLYVDGGFAQI